MSSGGANTNDPSPRAMRSAAVHVVRALREKGHVAYLAGGCVRDELLGLEPKDYDVATSAHPEQVQELFRRTNAVGASFGVVLVRERRCTTEVATFRADGPYADARRPDHVEYADAERDAQRRDFTINALFIDPMEDDPARRVIDYVNGRRDLDDRVLRAVGDAAARLREDHLRALRAVRFAARYGLRIEEGTADAIRAHASDLRGVSVERIGDEVRRMLGHASRAHAVKMLHKLGLDRAILGETDHAHALGVLERLDPGAAPMTALAAWAIDRSGRSKRGGAPGGAADVAGWRRALNLSNADAQHLARVHEIATRFVGEGDGAFERAALSAQKRLLADPLAGDALLLARAIDSEAGRRVARARDALAGDGVGIGPTPLLPGDALVRAGYVPGPGFGALLDAVYDAQLEGRVRDRVGAMRLAGDLAPGCGVERAGDGA
ncbi:MAG: CCA tRNA nucleotidyltransferase [Planctomycetota bacterium]